MPNPQTWLHRLDPSRNPTQAVNILQHAMTLGQTILLVEENNTVYAYPPTLNDGYATLDEHIMSELAAVRSVSLKLPEPSTATRWAWINPPEPDATYHLNPPDQLLVLCPTETLSAFLRRLTRTPELQIAELLGGKNAGSWLYVINIPDPATLYSDLRTFLIEECLWADDCIRQVKPFQKVFPSNLSQIMANHDDDS